MSTPVLWHFPISHYNEKVRWALDYKGIAHQRVALGPTYLLRAWWRTGGATLPVLHVDGASIGDSTHIIAALEKRNPEPALYPTDAKLRARALAIEDFFDEEVGAPVRSFLVGEMMRRDPSLAIDTLATGIGGMARVAKAIAPAFRLYYYGRHAIDDAAIDAAPKAIEAGFARIEEELGGGTYLAGDTFSVADLTAASILAPLVAPPQLQYPPERQLPEEVMRYRDSLANRPGFRFVLDMFERHRGEAVLAG